ncbi:hypothetical protein [Bacillus massiliglaciei]|uniref:hypothetical protein n=1 Tax=Bacillus massiliglaciei TaxID=1816693 RepID=UPI000AEDC9AA|nr:hypothetical protein [Bacillus massiliglaciei]
MEEQEENKRFSLFDKMIAVMPKIYVWGTLIIFAYAITALIHLGVTSWLGEQTDPPPMPVPNGAKETLITLIVAPIVRSEFYQIIFNTLFLYMVWILLFLLAPIAFLRLTRFKFFNLEFEIEKQEAAIFEVFSVSSSKMKFSSYLTSEEFQLEISEVIADSNDYLTPLKYTMDNAKEFYTRQLGLSFTYTIYSEEDFLRERLPRPLKHILEMAKSTGEPGISNKSEHDPAYAKNYLLFYFENMDGQFVTVLDSYETEFDTFDKSLLLILHNLIYDYYLQYNFIYDVAEGRINHDTPEN